MFPASKFCSSNRFSKEFWLKTPSYFFYLFHVTSLHFHFLSLPLFVFSPPPLHLHRTCLFLDVSMSIFFSPRAFSLNHTALQSLSSFLVSLTCLSRRVTPAVSPQIQHCDSLSPAPVKPPLWLTSPVVSFNQDKVGQTEFYSTLTPHWAVCLWLSCLSLFRLNT